MESAFLIISVTWHYSDCRIYRLDNGIQAIFNLIFRLKEGTQFKFVPSKKEHYWISVTEEAYWRLLDWEETELSDKWAEYQFQFF